MFDWGMLFSDRRWILLPSRMLRVMVPALASVLSASCMLNTVQMSLAPPSEGALELRETNLYFDEGRTAGEVKNVLLLPIEGEILDGNEGGGVYPGRIQRLLQKASNDSTIHAILLKVNSPGGSASASDTIYRMIRRFAARRKIPVYAHVESLGASGGYYIAMAANRVNAAPVSQVGSIGVIIRTFGVQGLMQKAGVEYRSIASGKNKDILSPFVELSDEQRDSLKQQVIQNYETFLSVVKTGRERRISEDRLRQLADGNIYNGEQAKESGLIDSVAPVEDFLAAMRSDLRASGLRVFSYLPEGRKDYNIYNTALPGIVSPEVRLMRLTRSGVFFLWEGGL